MHPSSTGWRCTELLVLSPSLCSVWRSRSRPNSCWTWSVLLGSSLVCSCFSVCIVSHLSSSPGRSFCWWESLLPVWGEGSFDEGTQWHQTLCSVPSPCSGGGGGPTGFQLECRGGICGKDLPEAQRGGTQAGHCHLKHSTCLLTGWLACLKSNHLSSGVWLPRVDFLCNFHLNLRVFFSILFYSSRN